MELNALSVKNKYCAKSRIGGDVHLTRDLSNKSCKGNQAKTSGSHGRASAAITVPTTDPGPPVAPPRWLGAATLPGALRVRMLLEEEDEEARGNKRAGM